MKRKFKIMGHQIEQLKEELSAKDLALVKEHFDHMKVGGVGLEAADMDRCLGCRGKGMPQQAQDVCCQCICSHMLQQAGLCAQGCRSSACSAPAPSPYTSYRMRLSPAVATPTG